MRLKQLISVVAATLTVTVMAATPATPIGRNGDGSAVGGNPLMLNAATVGSKMRAVGEFDRIVLSGAANAKVRVGAAITRVVVIAQPDVAERISTEVRAGTLYVGSVALDTSAHMHVVEISVPRLVAFRSEGSGNAVLDSVRGDRLDVEAAGSGAITAVGEVHAAKIEADGSGDVNLLQLKVDNAAVANAGSGEVRVCARRSLALAMDGSGKIRYCGGAEHVAQVVNGTGVITEL